MNKTLLKIISIFLIIAFLAFDISWACPELNTRGKDTLAIESNFQTGMMNDARQAFRESIFDNMRLLLAVENIAAYIFGDREKGLEPLPLEHMEAVLRTEEASVKDRFGTFLDGIDLARVVVKDGAVIVPYSADGTTSLIQILRKDNTSGNRIHGFQWLVSDKYVIGVLPEDFEAAGEPDSAKNETPKTSGPAVIVDETQIGFSSDQEPVTIPDDVGSGLRVKKSSVLIKALKFVGVLLLAMVLIRVDVPARGDDGWRASRDDYSQGDDTVSPLIPQLRNQIIGRSAADDLVKIGTSAVPQLIKAYKEGGLLTRQNAVYALGRIATSSLEKDIAQDVDDTLRGALEDKAKAVRDEAEKALELSKEEKELNETAAPETDAELYEEHRVKVPSGESGRAGTHRISLPVVITDRPFGYESPAPEEGEGSPSVPDADVPTNGWVASAPEDDEAGRENIEETPELVKIERYGSKMDEMFSELAKRKPLEPPPLLDMPKFEPMPEFETEAVEKDNENGYDTWDTDIRPRRVYEKEKTELEKLLEQASTGARDERLEAISGLKNKGSYTFYDKEREDILSALNSLLSDTDAEIKSAAEDAIYDINHPMLGGLYWYIFKYRTFQLVFFGGAAVLILSLYGRHIAALARLIRDSRKHSDDEARGSIKMLRTGKRYERRAGGVPAEVIFIISLITAVGAICFFVPDSLIKNVIFYSLLGYACIYIGLVTFNAVVKMLFPNYWWLINMEGYMTETGFTAWQHDRYIRKGLGPKAVKPIVVILQDKKNRSDVRELAITLLAKIGVDTPGVTEALIDALDDPDFSGVARQAAEILAETNDPMLLPILRAKGFQGMAFQLEKNIKESGPKNMAQDMESRLAELMTGADEYRVKEARFAIQAFRELVSGPKKFTYFTDNMVNSQVLKLTPSVRQYRKLLKGTRAVYNRLSRKEKLMLEIAVILHNIGYARPVARKDYRAAGAAAVKEILGSYGVTDKYFLNGVAEIVLRQGKMLELGTDVFPTDFRGLSESSMASIFITTVADLAGKADRRAPHDRPYNALSYQLLYELFTLHKDISRMNKGGFLRWRLTCAGMPRSVQLMGRGLELRESEVEQLVEMAGSDDVFSETWSGIIRNKISPIFTMIVRNSRPQERVDRIFKVMKLLAILAHMQMGANKKTRYIKIGVPEDCSDESVLKEIASRMEGLFDMPLNYITEGVVRKRIGSNPRGTIFGLSIQFGGDTVLISPERPLAADENIPEERLQVTANEEISGLWAVVNDSLNSRRAAFMKDMDTVSSYLRENNRTPTPAEFNDVTASLKIAALENINEAMNLDAPESVENAMNRLGNGLLALDADGLVSSVITRARAAKRQGQCLIIGLETDWINGYQRGGLQHKALSGLISEIKGLEGAMRSMGLDNVRIKFGSGEELAGSVRTEAGEMGTELSNVVVLASQKSFDSGAFDGLKSSHEEKKAFIACVNPALLDQFYASEGELVEKQLMIAIMDMLLITLELACGKDAPELEIIDDYDKELRMVVFLPPPVPMRYDDLKSLYEKYEKALRSA